MHEFEGPEIMRRYPSHGVKVQGFAQRVQSSELAGLGAIHELNTTTTQTQL